MSITQLATVRTQLTRSPRSRRSPRPQMSAPGDCERLGPIVLSYLLERGIGEGKLELGPSYQARRRENVVRSGSRESGPQALVKR
jgi:hypothetical protein